ncbi:MAG: outer membrane lipoprotein carrier protein LolA, partial [Gammaproteobacteria bacterium]|nr:outer membrane lipoprotein carrier protein LolA [Gammaproteobacteria bacterium]
RQKDTGFEELRLGFDAHHLRRMELVDGFGQTTQLGFSNVQDNVKLPADAFKFIPPKGVDVIGEGG